MNRSSPIHMDVGRVRVRAPELPQAPAGQVWADPVPLNEALLLLLVILHAILRLVLIFELGVSTHRGRLVDGVRAE